jgi:hypothetical protein
MNDSSGLSLLQFRLLTTIAVAALVLAVVNSMAFNANAEHRQAYNQRQQYIAQSAKLRQVGTELVKTMAQVAAQKNDQQLTDLLGQFGITFKTRPAGQPATSEAAP